MSWAIGALRVGALETTFRQEAELDLFVQQAVLPGLSHLLITAAELLIGAGYPPEAALLDLYLGGDLGYLLNAAAESGFSQTLRLGSLTGQYGALSRLERFSDPRLRRNMETVLSEIRASKFAQDWAAEYSAGYARLNLLKERYEALPLWDQEKQALRTWQTIPPPPVPDSA